jgi:hypothetical protein
MMGVPPRSRSTSPQPLTKRNVRQLILSLVAAALLLTGAASLSRLQRSDLSNSHLDEEKPPPSAVLQYLPLKPSLERAKKAKSIAAPRFVGYNSPYCSFLRNGE